jgi:hypothetical protein
MIADVLVRAALVVAAIVVAACLAFTLHAVRLEGQARSMVTSAKGRLSPAEVDRARGLLHRAESHNPDVSPKLTEAVVLGFAGRNREAAALLRAVLRDEPDNLRALIGLQANLARYDPAAAAGVAARIRSVAPPVGR